jgi:Zn-dependent alcohol dehydrogenase
VRGNTRLVATSNYSPWAIPQALAFMRRNLKRVPLERLVSHTFPLERISEAFHQAEWLRREGDPLRISRAAVSM